MAYVNRSNNRYFDWLCELVDIGRFGQNVSYYKLLAHLHEIEFTWTIPLDDNRANDGIKLRRRYDLHHIDKCREIGPCSVLEMMVALAVRCEEFMDDVAVGDRTGQWFWGMIRSLELQTMNDRQFDIDYVDDVIARFLNRDYAPDGRGGLFTVKHCAYDMRTVEIWWQLSWYLDSIT